MKRRALYTLLLALLAANLLLGARIYFYTAQAAPANDNPYENYKLLADVMEKVRHGIRGRRQTHLSGPGSRRPQGHARLPGSPQRIHGRPPL